MKTLAFLAALMPFPALAHVHVHPETAAPGAQVEIALKVGHGCAGAATTGLRVAIPAGLDAVQPLTLDGWQVTIVSDVPGGRVTEIRWTGGTLEDAAKGSFAFAARIVQANGDLVLPVVQTCGPHEVRWIETGAGQEHPAPVVKVTPGA